MPIEKIKPFHVTFVNFGRSSWRFAFAILQKVSNRQNNFQWEIIVVAEAELLTLENEEIHMPHS